MYLFNFEQEQQQLLCLTLIKWTDSSIDDDLRFGAAIGVPRVPLTGPLRKFSGRRVI